MMQEDRDIRDIRAGLTLREDRVKDAEAKTRGQHDYRFVLQYFSTSRDLHRTLVANVNYLVNEVEQLRANMDHNGESISIMEQQLVELEVLCCSLHPFPRDFGPKMRAPLAMPLARWRTEGCDWCRRRFRSP